MSGPMDDQDTVSDFEQASLERRLAEQSIIRQTIEKMRKRYRLLTLGIFTAFGGAALFWFFFACQLMPKMKCCLPHA